MSSLYDEDLNNLEEWIRRLKIEYDIFFAGNRMKPPEELRLRVEKTFKRLGEATSMSFSQRFLYNTLITRFYVYRDLWRRTLQGKESAEEITCGPPIAKHTQPPRAGRQKVTQDIQVSIGDPDSETEKIRYLYDELRRMKGGPAKVSPDISYQKFSAYVTAKALALKSKHQCLSVIFRIALEEDTIRFVAKADNNSG